MNNEICWKCFSCQSQKVTELVFKNPNDVNPFNLIKILKCNECQKYSAIYEPCLYNFHKNNYNDNKWNKIETKKEVVILTNDKYKDYLKLCEHIRTAFSNLSPSVNISSDECKIVTFSEIKN